MAYDIRLMKLVTGELVIGKYDQEKDCLNDVAAIQSIPTQQGVQMMMLPYGYPFEPNFSGTLEGKTFLYRYADTLKRTSGQVHRSQHQPHCWPAPRQDAVRLRPLPGGNGSSLIQVKQFRTIQS